MVVRPDSGTIYCMLAHGNIPTHELMPPDQHYASMDPSLRDVLTVGRPITGT